MSIEQYWDQLQTTIASLGGGLTLPHMVAGAFGAGGVVGGVGSFFSYLGARRKAKAAEQSAQSARDVAAAQATTALIDHLQREVTGLCNRMNECEGRHEECETRVGELSQKIEDSRREIEKLMKIPVPGYVNPQEG